MHRIARIALLAALASIPGEPASAGGPGKLASASEPCDRHAQSGYGLCVAPWARLTYGPAYKSYYVGGSKLLCPPAFLAQPEPRFPWEGTWGTDYNPRLTGVQLWWTHGRLYQDGPGQYEPDHKNVPFHLKYGRRR